MSKRRPVPVVGTVGVPARYGGFETLAEQLCAHLRPDDVELVVYCEKRGYARDERATSFLGHRRVFLPLRANGAASMIYDALALLHATFVVRAYDILVFGYSGAWLLPFLRMARPQARFIVNVDGMEWRRDKFSPGAKRLLKLLEWFAARFASVIVTDNDALATLFRDRYARSSVTIAYGGDHTLLDVPAPKHEPFGHYLAIARIEPENNTHVILEACQDAGVPLVFIGNWDASDYGRALRTRFGDVPGLGLLAPIYRQADLASWRRGAIGYIHGHSVGGTNPSLVEALFHADRLISFDCSFNRATLSGSGHYFADVASLRALLRPTPVDAIDDDTIATLRERYRWTRIVAAYRGLLSERSVGLLPIP